MPSTANHCCCGQSVTLNQLEKALQSIRSASSAGELQRAVQAIFLAGDVSRSHLELILEACVRVGISTPYNLHRQLDQALKQDPNLGRHFIRQLWDKEKDWDAHQLALRYAGKSMAWANLATETWKRLPEGRVESARLAKRSGDHDEVLKALYDQQDPHPRMLTNWPAPLREEAIRTTFASLVEMRRARLTVRFIPAMEQYEAFSLQRAGELTKLVESAYREPATKEVLVRWRKTWPHEPRMAMSLALVLHKREEHSLALNEAKIALKIGAPEKDARILSTQILQALGDHRALLVELAYLKRIRYWDDACESKATTAKEALTPDDVLRGRGNPQERGADFFTVLGKFTKGVPTLFGGRDTRLPWHEKVLNAAPVWVSPEGMAKTFAGQERALGKFFSGTALGDGLIAGTGAAVTYAFWLAMIRPEALHAATFITADNPETLTSLSNVFSAMGTETSSAIGSLDRLSGYYGEQLVAAHLSQAGHVVEFPSSPNQEGFDLLVDGHPLQIKLGTDPQAVWDHLHAHPDIPVLVGSDLAGQFGHHANVIVDHSISAADLHAGVLETAQGLHGLSGIDIWDVPWLTVGMAMLRHSHKLSSQSVDTGGYVTLVGQDVLAIGGGALVGKVVGGAMAGLLLGPFGVVVGSVLGATLGASGGRMSLDGSRNPALCNARDNVVKDLHSIGAWIVGPAKQVEQAWMRKSKSIQDWAWKARASGAIPVEVVDSLDLSVREAHLRAQSVVAWLESWDTSGEWGKAWRGWYAFKFAGRLGTPEAARRIEAVAKSLENYRSLSVAA